VTIPTDKKPHSDVPERTTMERAVTINHAELKLAPAMAAETTRYGFPFNSITRRTTAPCWQEMQFLFTEASASVMDLERRPATRRRHGPPSASLAQSCSQVKVI
jgi:hypothetical protein